MPVKKGDKVKVEYEGKLDDGTVFDSSDNHDEPLEFEVGSEELMQGFENALIGMEIGEEKSIRLKPDEAYGEHKAELVKQVPRSQLPENEKVEEGMMLIMGLPNGIQITAQIVEVTEDTVTLDLNHPLAGKELNFNIKLIDIIT